MNRKEAIIIPPQRESDWWEVGDLKLYMPRAFKATTMMVGDPESPVALCTGWSDPWDIVSGEAANSFSVIAPLREPLGVNILLHNLLANPQIRTVVIHRQGKFDDTEAAELPINILKAIWENGVTDDGLVIGTSHRLLPELIKNEMVQNLRTMIADVELMDLGDREISEAAFEAGRVRTLPPSRDRVVAPEFKIPEVLRFPSEGVSFQIRERRAFAAYLAFIGAIMRYGHDCALEKGGALVRELPFTRIVLEGNPGRFFEVPDWLGQIEGTQITLENLEGYYQRYVRPETYLVEIFSGVFKFFRPPEEKYLYAELLFAFPRPREVDLIVGSIFEEQGIEGVFRHLDRSFQIGGERRRIALQVVADSDLNDPEKIEILLEIFCPPTNQVADKIRRIKETPEDADKTIILWDPRTHGMQDRGRPCWLELDFLVREGKIQAHALFRSHDIGKGWLFNAYGIWHLWQDICQETGYEMGTMTIESESGHVYQGDVSWAKELWEKQLDETPPQLIFDPERADPRGNFVISLVDQEIVCVLVSPDGQPLLDLRGFTAGRVMAEINHFGLISQVSHALDIGAELTKAEVCRRLRIPYQQDRPLPWRKIAAF